MKKLHNIHNKYELDSFYKLVLEQGFKKQLIIEIKEEQVYKTQKQNKTFYSLLNAFFDSGFSSFNSLIDLKNNYKERMGIDVDYYVYFLREDIFSCINTNKLPKPYKVENINDIPRKDIACVNKVFKSFSEATQEQALKGIDLLIKDIYSSGATQDNKIQQILKGLGEYLLEDDNIFDNINNIFPNAKIIENDN